MITLDLRAARQIVRKALCTRCIYSHLVRGYEPREELIFCGCAFPQREVLFPVRECTDFRAEQIENAEMTTLEIYIGSATTKTEGVSLNHQKIPSFTCRNFFGFWRKSLIIRRRSPESPVMLS
jgi:hypothetical protein